jgi:hypothetical protein
MPEDLVCLGVGVDMSSDFTAPAVSAITIDTEQPQLRLCRIRSCASSAAAQNVAGYPQIVPDGTALDNTRYGLLLGRRKPTPRWRRSEPPGFIPSCGPSEINA